MKKFLLVTRFFYGVVRAILIYKMSPTFSTIRNEDGFQIRAIELKIPTKNGRNQY